MKLYEVPRNSRIKLQDGTELHFSHIDGMYSFCIDDDDQVVHVDASSEVSLLQTNPPVFVHNNRQEQPR